PAFAQEYKEAYNSAIEAAKAKNYTQAYADFNKAAKLASAANDKEIANKAIRVAAQIDYLVGKQLVQGEKFDEALKRFEQGIKLLPSYANNYEGKALALKKLERGEEAIQAYQTLIEFGKKNSNTEAVKSGEQGIRDYYIYLASSALGRKAEPSANDAREALTHLEKLETIVALDADAYFYMAVAHNATGNYAQAVSSADKALELHKGSRTDAAKIYFIKGEALMYNGNTAGAKEAFQNATYGSYKSLAEHYLQTL
ncbi:MAG: tetratricopeptide repeat protein, partial [Rhodothermales bacterium]